MQIEKRISMRRTRSADTSSILIKVIISLIGFTESLNLSSLLLHEVVDEKQLSNPGGKVIAA